MHGRFFAVTSLDTQTCLVTYFRVPDAVYRLLCATDTCREVAVPPTRETGFVLCVLSPGLLEEGTVLTSVPPARKRAASRPICVLAHTRLRSGRAVGKDASGTYSKAGLGCRLHWFPRRWSPASSEERKGPRARHCDCWVAGAVRALTAVASGRQAWHGCLPSRPHLRPTGCFPWGTFWGSQCPVLPQTSATGLFRNSGQGYTGSCHSWPPFLVLQEQFEFALTAVAEEVNAILQALPQ